MRELAVVGALLCALSGCDSSEGDDAGAPLDAGLDAGDAQDAGVDAGPSDAGPSDAGPSDAGPTDAGPDDAGLEDAGTVDGGPVIAGDTCGAAGDVTSGGTFTGTTVGASDTYSVSGSGCPAGGLGSSYDVAYVVRPAATTDYRVRVTPEADFDPMVWASDDCAADGCLAGARTFGAGAAEEITFTAPGGSDTFIVVEGALFNDAGEFTLLVTVE